MSEIPPPPAGSITVRPWVDPVVDDDGFDPRSRYVEVFWLGVLGPTATWLCDFSLTDMPDFSRDVSDISRDVSGRDISPLTGGAGSLDNGVQSGTAAKPDCVDGVAARFARWERSTKFVACDLASPRPFTVVLVDRFAD